VLYLILGNTIGRGDKARLNQAADYYRRALSQNPSYTRAQIGLAEATRAAAGCQPGQTRAQALNLAIDQYNAALTGHNGDDAADASLQMQARLGLGLTYQCLTTAKLGNRWADADAEFREALRLHATARLAGGDARHALRLAAEATAGQALTAFLTANQPDAVRYGGYPAAAAAYEEALQLLNRIDVIRPTNLERELIYLRNLRSVYQAMGASERGDVDERISATSSRLATIAKPR
jgi:tetratricopeptide (TPR) repeat protein